MSILKKQFLLFKIDEEKEDFTAIEIEDSPIHSLLDSNYIYIIVVPIDKEILIWHGSNASIRMKFIATQKAPTIRDKYGVDFKISAVDEEDESFEFKEMVDLE
jgi:hypothetical protein